MLEKFTERSMKVVMCAQEETRRLGHNFVGTEQVLLGLIIEGRGIAAQTLKSAGVTVDDARIEVEKIIGRGSGFVAVEIPFTPRAKRILELAWHEARKLGVDYIDTEHLLLGLLGEGEGVAARVLENLGVNLESLRTKILRSLPAGVGKLSPEDEKIFSSAFGINTRQQLEDITETSTALLKFLIGLLSKNIQQLVDELGDAILNKQTALDANEYDKASSLLSRQIELTEKIRKLSDQI